MGGRVGCGGQPLSMKVTLKYEEAEEKSAHMTLRLTLPQKYINGPTKNVVKLFVDHYNKKHEDAPLDADSLHIKIAGGDHLEPDAVVRDDMAHGDECFVLGEAARRPAKRVAASTPGVNSPSGTVPDTASKPPVKDDQGRVRCKRFGCQKFFDPEGEPTECIHHKAPPIFHETAKWWSCCPDRKAYDWEGFMRIPGCETGFCSANPEGQIGQKRFLGGCDVRASSAPVRLDQDAPKDPRVKLNDLRKGIVALGVDSALFDRVLNKLAAETEDLDAVVEKFRARFQSLVTSVTK